METILLQDQYGTKGKRYGVWEKFSLNKFGFFDSDDYDKIRDSHKVRILCMGDSITFGAFTPPDNWPKFMKRSLKAQGLDVEVINAAIPRNTMSNLIKRFEYEYFEFKPDFLIIYKGFRYYMRGGQRYKEHHGTLEKLVRKSAFFKQWLDKEPEDIYERLVKRREKLGITKLIKKITKEDVDLYRKDLLHLIEVCRRNKTTLILCPFISLVNEENKEKFLEYVYRTLYFYPALSVDAYLEGKKTFNRVTEEIAQQENLFYIDIRKGITCSKRFFSDDYHFTRAGSVRVGENFAQGLAEIIQKHLPEAETVSSLPKTSINEIQN